MLLLAVPLALALAPDPVVKIDRPSLIGRPSRGGDATPTGPHRAMHGITWRGLAGLVRGGLGQSGLAWFLAAWLISYTATNGLSVMFSVAMIRDYHVAATCRRRLMHSAWVAACRCIRKRCGDPT